MDNVVPGPWPKRENADVLLFGEYSNLRPSFADLATLAGSFGDAFDVALGRGGKQKPTVSDLIALTDALDTIALRARNFGYAHNKAAFLVVAQDVESLSERLVHLAAEHGAME